MTDKKILDAEKIADEVLSDGELDKVAGGIVSYPTKNNVPTDNDISEAAKPLLKFTGHFPGESSGSTGH